MTSSDISGPAAVIRVRASAGSIRAGQRHYFSTHHLYAARYAAEDAQARETALTGAGDLFDVRHRGLVLTAVTESAFFLEAAINEVYKDAVDGLSGKLGESSRLALATAWETTDVDREKPLAKYNVALRLAGKTPFNEGAEPHQNAAFLIQLRNELAHYKVETIYNDKAHRVGKRLVRRFAPNALMGEVNLWYPDRALGAGCASWAWRSARALTDEFARRMGIDMNYHLVDFGDPLPA